LCPINNVGRYDIKNKDIGPSPPSGRTLWPTMYVQQYQMMVLVATFIHRHRKVLQNLWNMHTSKRGSIRSQ